ncbi:MAG: S1 RNA-binding domain-containing protein, partial [Clostridia bacterium]|nr:S1 RNA-binding domain-containing protein [Clostridia bacterium]
MKEYYPEGILIKTDENMRRLQSAASIQAAAAEGAIIEAQAVLCDRSHDITVDLGCMKGIIRRDEGAIGIAGGTTRDIALISRVGKPVCFKVINVAEDENGAPYAVLSRRAAQEEAMEFFLENRIPGDVVMAKVTHLESFGAFCDIGCGNIALLPIDSISVSRISHPADRLSVGDRIRVIVKSIGEDGRITLSLKELLGT